MLEEVKTGEGGTERGRSTTTYAYSLADLCTPDVGHAVSKRPHSPIVARQRYRGRSKHCVQRLTRGGTPPDNRLVCLPKRGLREDTSGAITAFRTLSRGGVLDESAKTLSSRLRSSRTLPVFSIAALRAGTLCRQVLVIAVVSCI